MMKQVHSLVIAAALLGLPGWVACESARPSTPGAPGAGSPDETVGAERDSQASPHYVPQLIRSVDDIWEGTTEVDLAVNCAEGTCPTLEEALASSICQGPPKAEASPTWWKYQYVVSGCGLTSVHRAGFAYTGYWYDSFGTPPVAVLRSNDLPPTLWSQTRSIECPASEQQTCAVCGDGFPVCGQMPGWLPEPPPPPPPGCDCSPDGDGGARVSLECFCSIYGCPSLSGLIHGCDRLSDTSCQIPRATESCGTVWFNGDQRFGYDAATGALVAAEASIASAVLPPCLTTRVVAGATGNTGADAGAACVTPTDCDCTGGSEAGALAACTDTAWFEALANRFP